MIYAVVLSLFSILGLLVEYTPKVKKPKKETKFLVPAEVPSGGGVYSIEVLLLDTGEDFVYYGQTTNFSRRWQQHIKEIKQNVHHNFRIRYLRKTFSCQFTFKALVTIPVAGEANRALRIAIEQQLVDNNPECLNYVPRVYASFKCLPDRSSYRNRHLSLATKPLMGQRIVTIRDSRTDEFIGCEFWAGLATGITTKKFYTDEQCNLFVIGKQAKNSVKGYTK